MKKIALMLACLCVATAAMATPPTPPLELGNAALQVAQDKQAKGEKLSDSEEALLKDWRHDEDERGAIWAKTNPVCLNQGGGDMGPDCTSLAPEQLQGTYVTPQGRSKVSPAEQASLNKRLSEIETKWNKP